MVIDMAKGQATPCEFSGETQRSGSRGGSVGMRFLQASDYLDWGNCPKDRMDRIILVKS